MRIGGIPNRHPDVSRYNIDTMTDGEMTFVPGAYPEYDAFNNGLCGFDKEAFNRFRRSHHTQSNQNGVSYVQSQLRSLPAYGRIYTASKQNAIDRSKGLSHWLLLIGCDKKLPGSPGTG